MVLVSLAGCASANEGSTTAPDLSDSMPASPAAAPEVDQPTSTAPPPPAYTSDVYGDLAHWLCHPDKSDDACDIDLTTTRVERDGTRSIEQLQPEPAPPIDCFYVYPTVSTDPTPNSDLDAGDSERRVVAAQAAPFGTVCRLYAPVYRQITLAALSGTTDDVADRALAYRDVIDAWSHYLAHHNQGRGVVLIGHSQGAGHLRELLTRRIEDDPDERDLLVSAILLGSTVRAPVEPEHRLDAGYLTPCTTRDQTGCVVSFSTYPADAPPGDTGFFGGVRDTPDERALCTNPATLGGGAAPLASILIAHPSRDGGVTTPYVRYDGLVEGECVVSDQFHYLEVRYQSSAGDHWPTDLGGRLSSPWGLHLLDANVALGDLIDLVSHQGARHAGTRR
jgi:hypothetical protein